MGSPSPTKTCTKPSGSASVSARSSGPRARDVILGPVRKRLDHEDLDEASRPLAFLRRCRKAPQQSHCLVDGAFVRFASVLGDEHPQGDVLELAQLAEVVVSGQAPLARSTQGFGQPAPPQPHPRPQRRDGAHVGDGATGMHALRVVEQVDCACRSPRASFIRAFATRERYSYSSYAASSPRSPLLCKSSVAPSRSPRSRCRSLNPKYRFAVPCTTGAFCCVAR